MDVLVHAMKMNSIEFEIEHGTHGTERSFCCRLFSEMIYLKKMEFTKKPPRLRASAPPHFWPPRLRTFGLRASNTTRLLAKRRGGAEAFW